VQAVGEEYKAPQERQSRQHSFRVANR